MTMHKFYLDASALAKKYKTEAGSDFILELYKWARKKGERFYTSRHSIIEVGSIAMRLRREEKISEAEAYGMYNTFLEESERFVYFIRTNSGLENGSIRVMSKHPLKASDSLQLASALDVSSFFGSELHFVCDDDRLCNAALIEGLHVLRPRMSASLEYIKSL